MKTISLAVHFRYCLWIAGAVVVFLWPTILSQLFPYELNATLPSSIDLIPGALAIYLLIKLRCPYSRALGGAWILWYFVGSANAVASALVLGSYYSHPNLSQPTGIYLWGCACYIAGLLISSKYFGRRDGDRFGLNRRPAENIHPVVGAALLLFPVVWLVSIYLTIGYVPILAGVNIVEKMYQTNYGPLYAYGGVLIISNAYAFYKALTSPTRRGRLLYVLFAILLLLISTADGKRVFAMASVGGLLAISFRILGRKTWTTVLPAIGYVIIFLYVGVLLLRIGGEGPIVSEAQVLFVFIGVEFRDFVFTVNRYQPGEIQNYSWAVSALASMTNSVLLQALDLDKGALVGLDSARAWSALWDIDFGIRTGIVSELWFAYGLLAFPCLILFGLFSGWCVKLVRISRGGRELLFTSAFFGMLLLAIVGQSTSMFGILPVFVYAYIAIRLISLLLNTRRRQSVPFGFSLGASFRRRISNSIDY